MNQLYKIKRTDKYRLSFIVVLVLVVLCSCLLIGTVAAWLTRTYSYSDSDNQIGSVDMRLYNNNVEITGTTTEDGGVTKWTCAGPFELSGGLLNRSVNLTLRNLGTIDALVRVTISIYYIDDFDNASADTDKRVALLTSSEPTVHGTIKLNTTNWVYAFPSQTVASGNMFYSTKLAPYITRTPDPSGTGVVETPVAANNIKIVDNILVSSSQRDTTFYMDVTVDAVAYDGNIYKKIENNETGVNDIPVYALPFGKKESLPESWEAWK